jgi:hypothetical protein
MVGGAIGGHHAESRKTRGSEFGGRTYSFIAASAKS